MSQITMIDGHDGPIEIDGNRKTVTKIYSRLDHAIAVEKVRREVAYAGRLFEAFSQKEGLTCPRILGWDLSMPPRILMSLCPGEALSSFLRRLGRRDPRCKAIARGVCEGLDIYVRLFAAPYYDLGFQNLLYDEARQLLAFLDFGIPDRAEVNGAGTALEVSLGTLVGCSCYDLVRPSQIIAPKHGYMAVITAVLAEFGGRASERRVRETAHAAFIRLTGSGKATRQYYYRSMGTFLANRHLKQLGLASM